MSSQRTQVNSGPVTIRLEVPEPTPAPAASAEMPHESAHLSEPFSSILEEIASELELRPLLTSIITRACGLLGADDGAIGLYEPRRHVVQIEAVHRLPEAELGTEFEPNEGLVGRVLATGKPVIIENYGDLDRISLPEHAGNAVVGVPIPGPSGGLSRWHTGLPQQSSLACW